MLDKGESNVIYMCASAIIEVLKANWAYYIISDGEVGQRLGALALSPIGEREAYDREETVSYTHLRAHET